MAGPTTEQAGLQLQVGTWIRCMPALPETAGDADPDEADLAESEESSEEGDTPASPRDGSPKPFQELGDPLELAQSQELSSKFVARLESASRAEQTQLVEWLMEAVRPLALSRPGCRVVQKALEVAGGRGRDKLVAELGQLTVELYESPNGNHVLTKVVEVVPSASLGLVIHQLQEKGATVVARHRFGCRVLERLIEHCSERESKVLMDQIVASAEMLARHQYGNFVVQHLLEHGTKEQRNGILERLMHALPRLAMHRTASHVVQRLLDYCDQERQRLIVESLLRANAPAGLVEVACSRYGSFVAEQLATIGASRDMIRDRLAAHIDILGRSQFGWRVAERFGLELPEGLAPPPLEAAADEPSDSDE